MRYMFIISERNLRSNDKKWLRANKISTYVENFIGLTLVRDSREIGLKL